MATTVHQNTTIAGDRSEPLQMGQHYAPLPDQEKDGAVTAHAVQTIRADGRVLYELWRNISLIPRWQEHVISVSPGTGGVSHWVMGDPSKEDSPRIEFDSQITEDIPGEKIAWESVSGEVVQSGFVTFAPSPSGRGTLVTLIQTTKLPAGALGAAGSAIGKRGPKQTVIENLRHFKQLAETKEIPTVEGQPHGPRGISGGMKEWMYGENNPTPPGTSDL